MKKWARYVAIVVTVLIAFTLIAWSDSLDAPSTQAAPQVELEFIRWWWWNPVPSIQDVTGQLRIVSGDDTWYYESELVYDGDTCLEIGLVAVDPGAQIFRIFIVHYDADNTFHNDYAFNVAWSRLNHHFWFKADLVNENTIDVTIYDCDDEITIFHNTVTTIDNNTALIGATLSDEYWEPGLTGTFRGEYHKGDNYNWEDIDWGVDEWTYGCTPNDCPHKDGVQYAIPADSCECDLGPMALSIDKPLYIGNDGHELPFKASGSSRPPRLFVPSNAPNEGPCVEDTGCDLDLRPMGVQSSVNVWARMDSWYTGSDATPMPTPTNTPIPPTSTPLPRPTPTAPAPPSFEMIGYIDYWIAEVVVEDLFTATADSWNYWCEECFWNLCVDEAMEKGDGDAGYRSLVEGLNWIPWEGIGLGKPPENAICCTYVCLAYPYDSICRYTYDVVDEYYP